MKTIGIVVVFLVLGFGLMWFAGYVRGNANVQLTQKGHHQIQTLRDTVADEVRGH